MARIGHDRPWSRGNVVGAVAAIALAGLYLLTILHFWAPANGGVDQNGYFVGGRLLAETGSMRYRPESDYGMVGAMWVRTDDGSNFPKYPIGLPLLFATCFWVFGPQNGPYYANLVSPVGTSLAVLGMFFLARRFAGTFAGFAAMLLLGTSQVVLMLSINPNSHGPAIGAVVWGSYLAIVWGQRRGVIVGLLGGFLLGLAATIRYTEGLMLLPLGLMMYAQMPWRREEVFVDEPASIAPRRFLQIFGLLALAAVIVGVALVLPISRIVRDGRHVDPRWIALLALAATLVPIVTAIHRKRAESSRGVLCALAFLALAATALVGAWFGHPGALLLLPLIASLIVCVAHRPMARTDASRSLLVSGLVVVLTAIVLLGITVPSGVLLLAGVVYAVAALRSADLAAPAEFGQPPEGGVRGAIAIPFRSIWRAVASVLLIAGAVLSYREARRLGDHAVTARTSVVLLGATLLVCLYTLRRDRFTKRWRGHLDAPRVLIAVLIAAALIPLTTYFPRAFTEKAWLVAPLQIGTAMLCVAILHARADRPGRFIAVLMPLLGWLIPVGYLVGFNLVAMGSLTGYDTTNESDGNAFTLVNFYANWEKVVRQMHDVGLFFVVPLGVAGLALLCKRAPRAGMFAIAWLVPGLVLYASYYWSPERGVSYLRFFMTLMPAIVLGAAVTLSLVARTGTAGKIAVGVVVSAASCLGLYRTLEGFENGGRTIDNGLEVQHLTNSNLARLSEMVLRHAPPGATVFAENGQQAHYIQFAGHYEVFLGDAFTTRGGGRMTGRGSRTEGQPDPIQPKMREFYEQLYAGKTDDELRKEQESLIKKRLDAGRRVFVVTSDTGSRGSAQRFRGAGLQLKPLERQSDLPPVPDRSDPKSEAETPVTRRGRELARTWAVMEITYLPPPPPAPPPPVAPKVVPATKPTTVPTTRVSVSTTRPNAPSTRASGPTTQAAAPTTRGAATRPASTTQPVATRTS